jgi:thiol-disulfide isomerase/thioredoxin
MNKKNNLGLLIFAIIFLVAAIAFFVISGNLEFSNNSTTPKKISSNYNIADEDFVGNSVSNSISNSVLNSVSNNIANVSANVNQAAETGILNSVAEYQNFTVYDENGNEISLDSFSGKPVFILFWKNEEDSEKMLEILNKLYSSYSNKVTFLSITDYSEKNMASQYIAENNIQIPVYYEQNSAANQAYNISVYPSIVIKDKNNTIINVKEGLQDEDSILANLDILSENY